MSDDSRDAPSESRSPADILAAAADLVGAGWCQREYHKHRAGAPTCYCVEGAIYTAGYHLTRSSADRRTQEALRVMRVKVGPCLTSWNDQFGRTQGEVVTALRAASSWALETARPASPSLTPDARHD